MNTRRSSRLKFSPKYESFQEYKLFNRSIATNTDETLEDFEKENIGMNQRPVFNIHIHVPSPKDRTSKMYLPRIQPIIHLHFDELVKKLGVNETDILSNTIKDYVSMSIPKFGKIRFHYKNDSNDDTNSEISNCTSSTVMDERKVSIGTKRSGIDANHASFKNIGLKNNNNRNKRLKDDRCYTDINAYNVKQGSPIKLKKAVVVLEDISKSKIFREAFHNNSGKERKNGTCFDKTSINVRNMISNSELRKEDSIKKNFSNSENETESENDIKDDSCTRLSSDTKVNLESESNNNAEVHCNKKIIEAEKLIALIEGCSFSELLRRFREKHSKSHPFSTKQSSQSTQTNPTVKEENESVISIESPQNSELAIDDDDNDDDDDDGGDNDDDDNDGGDNDDDNEGGDDADDNDGDDDDDSDGDDDKDELKVEKIYDATTEGSDIETNVTEEPEIPTTPHPYNKEKYLDEEESEVNTCCSTDKFDKTIKLSSSVEELENSNSELTTNNSQSDYVEHNNEISEVTENMDVVDFESCNGTTNPSAKNEFDLPGTCEIDLKNTNSDNFPVNLIEKEMKKEMSRDNRESETSASKRKILPTDGSNSSTSPKKMKQSNKTPRKTTSLKSSAGKNYISLQVSGPTKFGVARIPDIQPYNTHEAKNFKNDRLFGNSVKRFSSPDKLRIYKLKQSARKLTS